MSAPRRVQDTEVIAAIIEWGGNLSAAADRLGIQRANLRKRIYALEDAGRLNLSILRSGPKGAKGSGSHSQEPPDPLGISGSLGSNQHGLHGPQKASGLFPEKGQVTTLTAVSQAAAVEIVPDAPMRGRRQLRMKASHQDRLREAKFDLIALWRRELDENRVLEMFFEESFEDWLKGMLAPRKASK